MQDAARIADFKPGLRDQAAYATAAAVSAVARRRERARVRAILYGMPDQELKDIGICRGEIEYLVSRQARE